MSVATRRPISTTNPSAFAARWARARRFALALPPRRGQTRPGWALLVLMAAFGPAISASASGFALREQSATALGNAFAGGAAAADDPSYMFFNPAALARQSGTQVVSVATYVRPSTRFRVQGAQTAAGQPITGGDGGANVTDAHWLPAFYATTEVADELGPLRGVKLGVALTTPFGLETDYESGWAGRYYALQSKLKTINVGPVVSFDVLPGLSLAAGPQAQYLDAELSNAIDFGSIGAAIPPLAPVARPTQQDGKARVKGDDWSVGWTAGLLYEPWAGTRLGVGYRSFVRQKVDGDARFRLDSAGIGRTIAARTGAFTNTSAKATVDTPETVTFGVHHAIDERWSVMADAAWTGWSRVNELRVRFGNPAQPDSVSDADWRDTWFFAGGVTYRPAPPWTLRFGVAHDQSPVPNRTRAPRVPDGDRTWLALGATYQPFANLEVGLAYAHIFGADASVDLSANEPGNLARGDLSGNVTADVDIIGLQLLWTF